MPEPESKSLDLEAPINAAGLAANYLLYLAKVGAVDPDEFNRSLQLGEFRDWLVTQIAPLKADGSIAGTAMQELKGLNFTDPTTLTIAAGVITVTQSLHIVAAQTGTADDLDTITQAKGTGDFLILSADAGDVITLKHGTGNLAIFDGADATITPTSPALLIKMGANWLVIKNPSIAALLANGTVAGTAMQEFLGINLTDPTIVEIASGAVTATQSLHAIAAETGTADDLDTITAAKGVGDLLIIAADTGDTITLKSGTGNIVTFSGTDQEITASSPALCIRFGANWLIIKNNAGGGVTDHGELDGLGDDDHTQYLRVDGTRAGTGMQEVLGINFTDPDILTIASGAITATKGMHIVAAQTGTADDLDTITAAKGVGDMLVISADTGDTITLTHSVGNIVTHNDLPHTITPNNPAVLFRMGGAWLFVGNQPIPQTVYPVPTSSTTVANTSRNLTHADHTKMVLLAPSTANRAITLTSQATSVTDGSPWQAGDWLWVSATSVATYTATLTVEAGVTLKRPGNLATGGSIVMVESASYLLWRFAEDIWYVIATNAFVRPPVTQALAEAGSNTGFYEWSPQRVRQAINAVRTYTEVQPYTGSAQDLTTTYADVSGGSITYTRKFASSVIKVSLSFQMSIGDATGVAHFKFFAAGSEIAAHRKTIRLPTDDTATIIEATYSNSAVGSIVFKWQAREYSAANEVKLHATSLWDGGAGVEASSAILTVVEIPN